MNFVKKAFVYIFLSFTVIISVFPILWVIMSAYKTNAAILSSPFSLPKSLDFSPFIKVYTQYNFLVYTFNSFFIASVSAIAGLLFFSMAAYVIAKYEFKGKTLFYLLFTLTLLVPGHARAQPIFALVNYFKLYDTKLALMLVYTAGGMALALFILKSAFMTVPKELNEAASIEGAGFWTIFWSINIPLVKSGLATSGVLMFLGNWNEYFYAMLLTSSKANRTLPLALGFFTEAFAYDYTKMFAALVMVILPGIIIYMLAQEQITNSVASSGIKG